MNKPFKCLGCGCTYDFNDCITNPGAQIEEDSIGCCYKCGFWWIFKNGKMQEYHPSAEELAIVNPKTLLESNIRFKEYEKKNRG